MTRKPEDAVPAKPAAAAARITAAQVVDYLRRHPDFLLRHPELLDGQMAPARRQGNGVVDLQQFMVERLRRDVAKLRADQDDLLANSRDNLSTQDRIHKAVLALLAARSFEHLIETVTTDLALLAPGAVERVLGRGREVLLRDDVEGDPMLFGGAAGLVRSDALLRLSVSRGTPLGLIAFGTRHPGYFNPGQGTELLGFLARVLEHTIREWLDLPP
jgi:uncharacterized protein YigA (DUF484 family)